MPRRRRSGSPYGVPHRARSDLALVPARTTARADDPAERTRGISLFLVDLREVRREQPEALEVTPVRTMFNNATTEVRYRDMRVPASALIGEEGHGFRYVIAMERRAHPARGRGGR